MIIVQSDNNMKRKRRADTYWMVQCIQGLWGGENMKCSKTQKSKKSKPSKASFPPLYTMQLEANAAMVYGSTFIVVL